MPRTDAYKLTVAFLALLAVALFAYPCLRATANLELEYNEGWNAYFQIRALTGASLYGPDLALFANNYPPLSFYLVGLAGQAMGDMVLAGRIASLLAVLVISVSCAVVARAAGTRRIDALLSGAAILSMLSAFAVDYVGINDPQLLAQGFLCAGFALYVRRGASGAALPLVALLFAAGLLCKHNVLALPLVVSLHQAWRGTMRQRILYFGTGTILAAIALAVIQARFGSAFFYNLLAPRQYDPARGILLTTEMLDLLQAPLAVTGLYYLLARDGRIATKAGAYLAVSLLLAMGFSGGAGTDTNLFFDAMIACAMGIGPAVAWLRNRTGATPRALAALALLAHAGLIFHMPIALGRFANDMAGSLAERESLFAADVAWLSRMEGPAICESILLCLRAGKPMWVDPYNATQGSASGRLPPDLLAGMLARREVPVLQVSSRRAHHPDEAIGNQVAPPRFINFADSVFDELERSYRVAHVGYSGRFYIPK